MGNVGGISGSKSVSTVSSNNAQTNQSKPKNTTGNAGLVKQTVQEKTLFNQAGLTKISLQAKAIPRMDAASEANLAKINPQVANRIRSMAADLRAQGIKISATSSYRSFAQQNALYAQGRTKPGPIVTKAKGGQSLHNYGLAVDVVPLGANGQPNWNVPNSTWQKIGAAGKKQGLEWGGDWKGFVDRPHFQLTAGRSVSSLHAQYNRNGGNLKAIWNDVNKSYQNVGGTSVPTTSTTPVSNRLQIGASGTNVVQLQKYLSKIGYPLAADGQFGTRTDAAVRAFQRSQNLIADGIYGPLTRAALAKAI